jgi:hypothetical protein
MNQIRFKTSNRILYESRPESPPKQVITVKKPNDKRKVPQERVNFDADLQVVVERAAGHKY